MKKIVTASKYYKCDSCGKEIRKGYKYEFNKTRVPVYEEELYQARYDGSLSVRYGEQIGIEYLQWRFCLDCRQEKVNQDECEHKRTGTYWDYIPGEAVKEPQYDYCLDCGKRECDTI